MSMVAFMSPGTRSEARDGKAVYRPSGLIEPAQLCWFPWVPSLATDMHVVVALPDPQTHSARARAGSTTAMSIEMLVRCFKRHFIV
jgi:hypothetical protein